MLHSYLTIPSSVVTFLFYFKHLIHWLALKKFHNVLSKCASNVMIANTLTTKSLCNWSRKQIFFHAPFKRLSKHKPILFTQHCLADHQYRHQLQENFWSRKNSWLPHIWMYPRTGHQRLCCWQWSSIFFSHCNYPAVSATILPPSILLSLSVRWRNWRWITCLILIRVELVCLYCHGSFNSVTTRPSAHCRFLQSCLFQLLRCADYLLENLMLVWPTYHAWHITIATLMQKLRKSIFCSAWKFYFFSYCETFVNIDFFSWQQWSAQHVQGIEPALICFSFLFKQGPCNASALFQLWQVFCRLSLPSNLIFFLFVLEWAGGGKMQ